jgi:diaminopimelate epimerase
VEKYGRVIETAPIFPNRTNTEFATVLDGGRIRMRVWERGAGETMACGTGACATLAAAAANGLTGRKAELVLNGGSLLIEWDEKTGRIYQEGPAEFVFDGEWKL